MNRARVARALPLVLAAVLLSGCQAVHAGAAATIGSSRISDTDLQRIVDRDLAVKAIADQVGTERPAFQRQVLTNLVRSDLTAAAAARRGITVSDGEVQAQLADLQQRAGGQQALEAQAAQSLVAPAELRTVLRDSLYRQKLGDALTASVQVPAAQLQALYQQDIAQYDQVLARHVVVATLAEAREVLAQVSRAPGTFAQVAATRSLDTSTKATGGVLPAIGRGSSGTKLEAALFAAKPGTFGISKEQDGFHVYQLLGRRTQTLAQVAPALRRQALQQKAQDALLAELRVAERRQQVSVNPRFGRWDGSNVLVTEATSAVSSPDAGGAPAQQQVTPGGPTGQ